MAAFTQQDLLGLLTHLKTFNAAPDQPGLTRLAYTPQDEAVHHYIIELMKKHSLQVRQDAAGNVFARLPGRADHLPAIATGSHLDTVPQGGMYDGIVGVVSGLYALLQFSPQQLNRSLELIIFRSEESSRFGVSCLGSKIATGLADYAKWTSLVDKNNITIFQAIDEAGYISQQLADCLLPPDYLDAFIEVHIEQGKCLEAAQKSIGVVTGIAAPTRFCVEIYGQADHSGATPMDQRQDALVAASSLVLAVHHLADKEAYLGTVGTVGKLDVTPNAMNVIPGYVRLYVDIRGIKLSSINRVVEGLKLAINKVMQQFHVNINATLLSQEHPVKLNAQLTQQIATLCQQKQIAYMDIISGAGHDAMNMAQRFPAAMIFIPSRQGISHHHDEYSKAEDIVLAADLLAHTMQQLADR